MNDPASKVKVRKKQLGSYPFFNTVFSITLALLVIGVFGVLLIFGKEIERNVRENFNIHVYLKNGINEAQRLQIAKNLSAQNFIPADKKETNIKFDSKEAYAEKYIKETGEDFRQLLTQNPFRDRFVVLVAPEYQNKQALDKIKADLEQINGVFEVYYPETTIASFNKNIRTVGLVLLGVAALLFVVVVILINNTLRLALFSQRFLIRSMQLVGARRWFIQVPFITRAAVLGLVAGIVASGTLLALVSVANKQIAELQPVQNNARMTMLLGGLVLLGIFVAILSTYRAVSKYLKLSLDELY